MCVLYEDHRRFFATITSETEEVIARLESIVMSELCAVVGHVTVFVLHEGLTKEPRRGTIVSVTQKRG